MTRRALFVAYGGGHVAMMLPVIAALREVAPDLECTLMALTTGHARAVAAGVPALGYKDFLHLVDAPAALAWGGKLGEGNHSPDVSREETLAYLGINYLDLEQQLGPQEAAAAYARHGRFGFLPLNFMRRVLESVRPDVVVTTNSPRSEQAALESAVALGIPSIGLIDLFAQDADAFVHRPIRPDLTCVLAESVRERVIARGFDPARVAVTGNPAFDALNAPSARQAARALRERLGWQERRVILWAGQSEPAGAVTGGDRFAFAAGIEAALRAQVRQRPDLALVVRYHPGEWQHFPDQGAQDRVHFSRPALEAIQPLILASDVVLVQNSTVGLEAAIAGIPVVSIEFSESVRQSFSLARLGVSSGCDSPDRLPADLAAALARGPGQAGEFASDGRAAFRVAQRVHALASRR